MNIVFVNPFFPPWAPGGAEHSLEQLCKQFVEAGWVVSVIAISLDNRVGQEKRDGYSIYWLAAPVMVSPGQDVPDLPYLHSEKYVADVCLTFSHLESTPDVLIANNAQSYRAVAALSQKYKIPSVGIVRDTQLICGPGACIDNCPASQAKSCSGYIGSGVCNIRFNKVRGDYGFRPWPAWLFQGMFNHRKRLALRRASERFIYLVNISDSLKMLIKEAMPNYPVERLITIHNLTTIVEPVKVEEINTFMSSHDLAPGKYFLFAGRKTYGKGADVAARAIQIAKAKGLSHKLVLVGRGSTGCQDSSIIDEASVSQSLLLALLEHAKALIIPGRWQEGLHRTMIDALRLGIPIICSEAGAPAVDGVIHGKNGLVCSCNNPDALSLVMMDILTWDQQRLENCRVHSQDIFNRRFKNNIVLSQWRTLFDEF